MALQVLDATGNPQTIETLPPVSRKAANLSLPTAMSTEDKAALDLVNTNLGVIDGRVDGLEAAVAATNTLLTTQNGYLDGVETAIALTNTKLDSLAGLVDTVEALIASSNTKLDAANTSLDNIEASAVSVTPAPTNQTQVNGNTVLTGNGNTGTGSVRVTVAGDNTPFGVKLAQDEYEVVGASATNQALGATGAIGDYLSHVTVYPATTTPGSVVIKDGTTTIGTFPGGSGSVSNLIPFVIPIGAKSVSGAWNITTTTNVACVPVGDFT